MEFPAGFKSVYKRGVFGAIVGGLAHIESFCAQLNFVLVVEYESCGGWAWIPPASSVGISNDLFSFFCQCTNSLQPSFATTRIRLRQWELKVFIVRASYFGSSPALSSTSIRVQVGHRIIPSLVIRRLTHSAVTPMKHPPHV